MLTRDFLNLNQNLNQVLEGHLEAVLALAVGGGHLISGSYDTTVGSCLLQAGNSGSTPPLIPRSVLS